MRNSRFVGLDVSITNTGYCVLTDADADGYGFRTEMIGSIKTKPDSTDIERFDYIVDALGMKIGMSPTDDHIMIENYAHQTRKGDTLIRLAELCGILKNRLFRSGFKPSQIWLCSPSTLKKFVLGSGVGDKNRILKEVWKKWGLDVNDDNQADAYVLSRMCLALHLYDSTNYMCSEKHEHECMVSLFSQNRLDSSKLRKYQGPQQRENQPIRRRRQNG